MSTEIEQTELDGGASNGAADEIVARAGGFRRWAPQVLAMLLAAYGIWAFVNVLEVRQVRDRMHRLQVWQGELHEVHVAAEHAGGAAALTEITDARLRALSRAIAASEEPPLSIDAQWANGALRDLIASEQATGVRSGGRRRVQIARTLYESVELALHAALDELDARVDALYGFLGGTLVLSLTILLQTLVAVRRGDELLGLHARLASRLRALRVAQKSLELSEERYELASRSSNDGMWDWSTDGDDVYFSERWAELVGAEPTHLSGTPDDWFRRVHPDDVAALRAAIDAYLAAPVGVFEHEHRLLRRDGVYIVAMSRGIAVRARDGYALRFVGSHTDVTHARVLDRMKRQFLSTMSHELRTPLTSILGSLGLVRGGAVPGVSDASRALVDVAYENSVRLLRLINEILDYDRLRSGDAVFDRRAFDLVTLVRHIGAALTAELKTRQVELAYRVPDHAVWTLGDSERIGSVIARLVDNAARHAPSGSVVTVALETDGDEVVVSVIDGGPGVPPELEHRIFDAFTQVDESDARNVDGAGLGLSACRLIIEAHDGTIGYRRDDMTHFYFVLQTCPQSTEAAADV